MGDREESEKVPPQENETLAILNRGHYPAYLRAPRQSRPIRG